ncbi:MAG: hypothetical protein JW894_04530 [Bacteroidales bacterium]|nr:hypothetical protein [Bacteroidales bacterium]
MAVTNYFSQTLNLRPAGLNGYFTLLDILTKELDKHLIHLSADMAELDTVSPPLDEGSGLLSAGQADLDEGSALSEDSYKHSLSH